MPGSRGSNPDGTSPAAIAEWQARRFAELRRRRARAARPSMDDALPDDPIEEPERARAAIDRIRSGE